MRHAHWQTESGNRLELTKHNYWALKRMLLKYKRTKLDFEPLLQQPFL